MAGFEKHLTQLETVVERLERGDLTLDEAVRLFEEGMQLSHSCKEELEHVEGRIQVLVEGKAGQMQVAELQVENEEFGEESEVEQGEDEE